MGELGLTFGRLTVVDTFVYARSGTKTWVCRCECGRTVNRQPSDLRNGKYTAGCQSCARGLDLVGKVYGDLTVVSLSKKTRRGTYWNCKCACGRTCERIAYHLKDVKRAACGECTLQRWGECNITHGGSNSPVYGRWKSMQDRCKNPSHASYGRYGGRGIKVCAEWSDFKAFEAWAAKANFHPSLELDRVNNDRGYSPGNCEWITKKENLARMFAYHRERGTGVYGQC